MPDERVTKSAERCSLHPGSAAVATCDGCGRRLCLSCAVPVRGRVLGQECLAEALGDESPPQPAEGGSRSSRVRDLVAGISFTVAVITTILPWSRFGEGAGMFGAWGRPRWSTLTAAAAVLGLLLWLVRGRAPALSGAGWNLALAGLGALVALGGVLAGLRPPFASRAWFAPWLAAATGVVALLACLPTPVRRVRQDAERS
ncbi:MAG TPA: hypothetical protein VF984_13235 [Actinomycetota bacterium]